MGKLLVLGAATITVVYLGLIVWLSGSAIPLVPRTDARGGMNEFYILVALLPLIPIWRWVIRMARRIDASNAAVKTKKP